MEFSLFVLLPFSFQCLHSAGDHDSYPARKVHVRTHKTGDESDPGCASASINSRDEGHESPSLLKPPWGRISPYFQPLGSLDSSHQVKAPTPFKLDPFRPSPAIVYFL